MSVPSCVLDQEEALQSILVPVLIVLRSVSRVFKEGSYVAHL